MRQGRGARSGRKAVLLTSLALLLTGCSAGDWERDLRFGWPTGVTRQATEMRTLWTWAGVTALVLGVIVWGLIFWCCVRYRKRPGDDTIPRQTKYNFRIEMICVIFPFIVIVGLFYRTVVVEDNVNHLSKNPDAMVQVVAFKWNWQFDYQSYRGVAGQTTATPTTEAYSTGAGMLKNPLNSKLPYYLSTVGSQDEIPVLVLPVNQTVQVIEHSDDVIHSFWVPEFTFKRDVFPYGTTSTSRDNRFEFTATRTGSYVGRCAELCGVYHSQMNFEVRVVPQQTFVKYLAALKAIGPNDPSRQWKALKIAMPTQNPYATTTYPLESSRDARRAALKPGA